MIASKFRVNRQITRRGFTLMELMIVVAIIFIILAIAVPKYNNARMQANELSALRMVGTLHTTQAQYQSQFGKYAVTLQELGPPPAASPAPPRPISSPANSPRARSPATSSRCKARPAAIR